MKVNRLGFRDYRNLKENELIPGPQVNVICGDNAQGKTNLLEAVWLFTGGRSFRGARDQELIAFPPRPARAGAGFRGGGTGADGENHHRPGGEKRAAQLNGVDQPAASSLIGKFCAVVFSPDHLSLVKEGPSMRRKFWMPPFARETRLCQAAEPIQPDPGPKEYPAQGYFLSFGAFGNPGDLGRKAIGTGGGYYHRTKALS